VKADRVGNVKNKSTCVLISCKVLRIALVLFEPLTVESETPKYEVRHKVHKQTIGDDNA
jgi:hypothetical protein